MALAVHACRGNGELPQVNPPSYESVTVFDLVTKGRALDSARVSVDGWLRIEFEGNALYATRDAFDGHREKDAVWLDLTSPKDPKLASLNGQYVRIKARFEAYEHGHLGAYAGALREINDISASPQSERTNVF